MKNKKPKVPGSDDLCEDHVKLMQALKPRMMFNHAARSLNMNDGAEVVVVNNPAPPAQPAPPAVPVDPTVARLNSIKNRTGFVGDRNTLNNHLERIGALPGLPQARFLENIKNIINAIRSQDKVRIVHEICFEWCSVNDEVFDETDRVQLRDMTLKLNGWRNFEAFTNTSGWM